MFRQIKYFQAVVRYHSFSEAAEACHISQSAISQQIQALERELGFLLLERKNRSFELMLESVENRQNESVEFSQF